MSSGEDDISPTAPCWTPFARVVGYRQVTDAHLLSLAIRHHGRLATFDRGLTALADPESRDTLELIGGRLATPPRQRAPRLAPPPPSPYNSRRYRIRTSIPARCTPMLAAEAIQARRGGFTRRKFIKGVIATGATASACGIPVP